MLHCHIDPGTGKTGCLMLSTNYFMHIFSKVKFKKVRTHKLDQLHPGHDILCPNCSYSVNCLITKVKINHKD